MSIAKTKIEKSNVEPTIISLEDNQISRIYLGAVRHEYNSRYFKKRKNKVSETLLTTEDIKNIKLNVDYNCENNHYYKTTLKNQKSIKLRMFIPNVVQIIDNTVIMKNESYIYKFTISDIDLSKIPSNGIYNEAMITEKNGKPILVLNLESFKEKLLTPHKQKVVIENKLDLVESSTKRDYTLDVLDTPSSKIRARKIKRSRQIANQNRLFKILKNLHDKFTNNKQESVKAFLNNSSENQRELEGFIFSEEVRLLMVQDFINLGVSRIDLIEQVCSIDTK